MRVKHETAAKAVPSVERIAYDGMHQVRQVDANLVTSARDELRLHKRETAFNRHRTEQRLGRLARTPHTHAPRIVAG